MKTETLLWILGGGAVLWFLTSQQQTPAPPPVSAATAPAVTPLLLGAPAPAVFKPINSIPVQGPTGILTPDPTGGPLQSLQGLSVYGGWGK